MPEKDTTANERALAEDKYKTLRWNTRPSSENMNLLIIIIIHIFV